MSTYLVMAPPDLKDTVASFDAAQRIVFVPDRFSWLALLYSLPFLLWHRMWLVFLAYLTVSLIIEMAAISIGGFAPTVAAVALALFFALEANGLRRWTLERKGWRMIALSCGADQEEAELRFFNSLRTTPTTPEPTTSSHSSGIVPRIGTEHVIGLTLGAGAGR